MRSLVLLVALVLATGVLTQLLWPALRGRPLFPLLRRRSRMQSRLQDARHRKEEAEAFAEAMRMETEASRIEGAAGDELVELLEDKETERRR